MWHFSYSMFSFLLALVLTIILVIIALFWSFCGATPDPWAAQRFNWAISFTLIFVVLGILGFLLERRAQMHMLASRVGGEMMSPRL